MIAPPPTTVAKNGEHFTEFKQRAFTRMTTAAERYADLSDPRPLADLDDKNYLEQVRVQCGMSRAQIFDLIGTKRGRKGLLGVDTAHIDPIFTTRATTLQQLYVQWEAQLIERLAQHPHPDSLTTREVARAIDLSEALVYNLIGRGLLVPTETSTKAHTFTTAQVLDLIVRGKNYVRTRTDGRKHSPLSMPFLRWIDRQGGFETLHYQRIMQGAEAS